MADKPADKPADSESDKNKLTTTDTPAPVPQGDANKIDMLPDGFADGEMHVGLAITLTSDGKPSAIMIPDATKVKEGAPVYVTGQIKLKGENLKPFLQDKGITLPPELDRLITASSISCDAFYYSTDVIEITSGAKGTEGDYRKKLGLDGADNDKAWAAWKASHTNATNKKVEIDEGAVLIMFSLSFDNGLIGALTGNDSLSKLFDVQGGSVRAMRCTSTSRKKLEAYVKMLQS